MYITNIENIRNSRLRTQLERDYEGTSSFQGQLSQHNVSDLNCSVVFIEVGSLCTEIQCIPL